MKKQIHAAQLNTPAKQSHSSLRRFARKLFASLIKRQNQKFHEVMQKLQDIEETLEIMAREMARQLKR